MTISADTLASLSAIAYTNQGHDLRGFLFTRYIEHFRSQRLVEALADGGLPVEPIPASVVANNGAIFLCRFETAGKKLHVIVRSLEDDVAELLIEPHRVVVLPKATSAEAIEMAIALIEDLNGQLTQLKCQESWHN